MLVPFKTFQKKSRRTQDKPWSEIRCLKEEEVFWFNSNTRLSSAAVGRYCCGQNAITRLASRNKHAEWSAQIFHACKFTWSMLQHWQIENEFKLQTCNWELLLITVAPRIEMLAVDLTRRAQRDRCSEAKTIKSRYSKKSFPKFHYAIFFIFLILLTSIPAFNYFTVMRVSWQSCHCHDRLVSLSTIDS